jgi:hypothetical protein
MSVKRLDPARLARSGIPVNMYQLQLFKRKLRAAVEKSGRWTESKKSFACGEKTQSEEALRLLRA